MRPLFRTALEVEGIAPFRALDKLAKRGIFVFGVQKLSPVRLKIRVKSKETQKVFAIFRGSCYTVTKAKNESLARLVSAAAKRPGAVAAAVLFVLLAALGSSFVFRIDVVGSAAYRRSIAERCLADAGVQTFRLYNAAAAEEAESSLLSLPGIVFAEVKKSGTVVTVTLEEEEEILPPVYERSLYAPCAGEVEELAVLRGTALVSAGDTVAAGQELAGGFYLTESGERRETFAVARCSLIKTYAGEYRSAEKSAKAMRDAVAAVSAEAGGEVISSQADVRQEGEEFIYTVTLRVRVVCAVNI